MQQNKPKSVYSFGRVSALMSKIDKAAVMAAIVLLLFMAWSWFSALPFVWNFQFNRYELLPIVNLAISVVLLLLLIIRIGDNRVKQWFAVFIGFEIIWSMAESFQRMSVDPAGALIWTRVTYMATALLPVAFYLFVRDYVETRSRSRETGTLLVLMTVALLLASAMFVVPVSLSSNVVREAWGYVIINPPLVLILDGWIGIIVFLAILRLAIYRNRSQDPKQRIQAEIIIAITIFAMCVTGIVDVALPMLGIHVLPVGALVNSIISIGVLYSMYRYGTFAVDVSSMTGEIADALGEAVIVTDSMFNIRWMNRRVAEMSGFEAPDLDGRSISKLIGEEALEQLDDKDEKRDSLAAGNSSSEAHMATASGQDLPVTLSVQYVQEPVPAYVFALGDISKLVASYDKGISRNEELEQANQAFQDQQSAMLNLLEDSRELEKQLTVEKQSVDRKIAERTIELRAERESLEAIINGVDFGVYMIGPDLHVNMVNKPMQKLYVSAMDKPYTLESFDTDVQGFVETQLDVKEALKTQAPVSRTEYPRGNRILRSFRSPLYEPDSKPLKLLGIINVLQDITEAKAAERSRDEFFSIASHELRTPLTAIRGNTSMIQQYFGDQLKDPSLKEMINDIHDSSTRLINIVNDFLNTSRLEQGKMEFKAAAFDLPNLVNEVIEELRAGNVAGKVPIVTHLGAVPTAMADRDRLKEVIINLISNAVKFTEDGTIMVNLEMENEWLKLSVKDTGRGIPQESQGLLFHKFQQASNNILTRDSTRSTGLGLYISKLLMTGMGGEIFLEKSAAGKGTTFAVLIPTAKPVKPPKLGKTRPALTGVKS